MNEQPEFLKQPESKNNKETPAKVKELIDLEAKELARIAQIIEQEEDSDRKKVLVRRLEMARLSSSVAAIEKPQ